MEPCISTASKIPLRLLCGGRAAGIRGTVGSCWEADGSMDSRRATVLLLALLILTEWGHTIGAGGPGGWHEGDHLFQMPPAPQEEDNVLRMPQDAQTPGSLIRSLLQAMRRPGRSPAFLFQPQRFGRNSRNSESSWSSERLSPRAGEGPSSLFWNLAAPQRFGKK